MTVRTLMAPSAQMLPSMVPRALMAAHIACLAIQRIFRTRCVLMIQSGSYCCSLRPTTQLACLGGLRYVILLDDEVRPCRQELQQRNHDSAMLLDSTKSNRNRWQRLIKSLRNGGLRSTRSLSCALQRAFHCFHEDVVYHPVSVRIEFRRLRHSWLRLRQPAVATRHCDPERPTPFLPACSGGPRAPYADAGRFHSGASFVLRFRGSADRYLRQRGPIARAP